MAGGVQLDAGNLMQVKKKREPREKLCFSGRPFSLVVVIGMERRLNRWRSTVCERSAASAVSWVSFFCAWACHWWVCSCGDGWDMCMNEDSNELLCARRRCGLLPFFLPISPRLLHPSLVRARSDRRSASLWLLVDFLYAPESFLMIMQTATQTDVFSKMFMSN